MNSDSLHAQFANFNHRCSDNSTNPVCRLIAAFVSLTAFSDGRYRLCEEKPLFMQEFSTLTAIQEYWEQTIVPATSTEFGMAYELPTVEANVVMWDFIGDPRYTDTSIITRRIRRG